MKLVSSLDEKFDKLGLPREDEFYNNPAVKKASDRIISNARYELENGNKSELRKRFASGAADCIKDREACKFSLFCDTENRIRRCECALNDFKYNIEKLETLVRTGRNRASEARKLGESLINFYKTNPDMVQILESSGDRITCEIDSRVSSSALSAEKELESYASAIDERLHTVDLVSKKLGISEKIDPLNHVIENLKSIIKVKEKIDELKKEDPDRMVPKLRELRRLLLNVDIDGYLETDQSSAKTLANIFSMDENSEIISEIKSLNGTFLNPSPETPESNKRIDDIMQFSIDEWFMDKSAVMGMLMTLKHLI